MDIKEQILVALGLNKTEDTIKLSWQAKSEDGTIFVSTADELAANVDVSVLTEDGTTILLPVGTYKTDTGVTFRVDKEGIVAEVLETESEETETPKEEAESEKEEMGEDRGEDDDEASVDDWEGMEKRIKNLEDAVADLKSKMAKEEDYEEEEDKEEEVEMTEENVEPSKTPKTITTKEVVEFSAADFEALKKENEKLKEELNKKPADSPINTNKFSSEKPKLSKAAFKKLSKREKILFTLSNK